MASSLTPMLKRHIVWLREQALKNGSGDPVSLFPREDGRLMDKDGLGSAFRRTMKRDEITRAHVVYDLRHTYASLLLAAGAPITYVSSQLGHSTPATTLRVYARWVPSKGQKWVNALDRMPSESFQEPVSGTKTAEGR